MRSLLVAAVVFSGLVSGPFGRAAFAAELDQLSIQLSSRFGQTPSTSTLTFTAGKPGYFVLTGRFNDIVKVTAGGMNIPPKTIREFWNNQVSPLETIEKTQLADGRSRVLVKLKSPRLEFNGGIVTIKSPNGVLIDSDPIVVK